MRHDIATRFFDPATLSKSSASRRASQRPDRALKRWRLARPPRPALEAPRAFVKNSFETPRFGTLDTMIFGLVRRVVSLVCFLLVAYAATTVPVGRRTTWGHLVAIFTAPPAREAAEDLENIAAGALHRKAETAPAPAGRDPNAPKTRTP